MKKYVLYSHGGSRNHGCEALVRSTVKLLNEEKDNIKLVSHKPYEDEKYGIQTLVQVFLNGTVGNVKKATLRYLKAYLKIKLNNDHALMNALYEMRGIGVQKGDVALSIGGDNYCYDGLCDTLIEENKKWRAGGLKTVFWGCSIEPELLENEKIAKDIASFDLITARETISYEALRKVNSNTVLVCDSAFLLDKKDVALPNGFEDGNIVGINSSPLIESCENIKGVARKNFEELIKHILNETDMKIMLIPHVVRDGNDDSKVLGELYQEYKHTNRIYMVDDSDCETLKGYISKCRFFVGARTHSTIAAYSTCVPTLVVGYSVKAKGIARDLFGTEENYVLPVQNLIEDDDLKKAFDWMRNNEESIRKCLENIMPEYKKRVDKGIKAVKEL